jgi:glycosyltransferase involved in cell wall biosynthesis
MDRKRILLLAFSHLRHDARVQRQISFLKEDYQVTAVCFGADTQEGYEVVLTGHKLTVWKRAAAAVLLLTRQYTRAHHLLYPVRQIRERLRGRSYDLVMANDVETLPVAFALFPDARVLFDSHEYAPRHFEDKWVWRVFFQRFTLHLCTTYFPRLAAMTTVCEGLADEYHRNFGIRPAVLTNATRYHELEPSPTDPDRVRLIHHGGANPSRRIEWMIDSVDRLGDRFTLDLMLITPPMANRRTRDYLDRLKERVRGHDRIRILPPVPSEEIVPLIRRYDAGIFLIPPINFNYAHTLPNKLFDFIQARLAVVIGPTPEMVRVVNRYDIGVVSDAFTPESLAGALSTLTPEKVAYYKSQSAKAAAIENAEVNRVLLRRIVTDVLSKR